MFVDRQHQPPRVTWQRCPSSAFCLGTITHRQRWLWLTACGFSDQSPPVFVPNPLDRLMRKPISSGSAGRRYDDYFRVAREQPVQKSNGVVLDGRLETSYQIGASILEPQAKIRPLDSSDCKAHFSPSGDELLSLFDLPPLGIAWRSLCKKRSRIPIVFSVLQRTQW